MNLTPSTGTSRSRLLASAASVLGFAHLAGLAPIEAAAPRQEPTLSASPAPGGDTVVNQPAEAKKHDERHGDGKFKPAENSGDGDGEEDEDEDGDDESDEKDMATDGKSKAVRCARSRERTRCAAILGAPEAAKNIQLAAHLAFETTLSRSAAMAALKKGIAASSPGGLAGRMATVTPPNVHAGVERSQAAPRGAIAASWDRAMTKNRR